MSPEDAKKEIADYVKREIEATVANLRKHGIQCDWTGKVSFDFSEEDIKRYIQNKEKQSANLVRKLAQFFMQI